MSEPSKKELVKWLTERLYQVAPHQVALVTTIVNESQSSSAGTVFELGREWQRLVDANELARLKCKHFWHRGHKAGMSRIGSCPECKMDPVEPCDHPWHREVGSCPKCRHQESHNGR